MKAVTVLLTILWINWSSIAHSFTVSQAQKCADTLLEAYNNKTYPRKFLAVENIVATAFGTVFRSFSEKDTELALGVGEALIRESFEAPSGKYKYWDLVIATAEKTNKKNEYRVEGEVSVQSPKGNGRYTFLALVLTPGCKVRQVRVAEIMTLVNQLQELLAHDTRVRKLYND